MGETQQVARWSQRIVPAVGVVALMSGCSSAPTHTYYPRVKCEGIGPDNSVSVFPNYTGIEDGKLQFECRPPDNSRSEIQEATRNPSSITVFEQEPPTLSREAIKQEEKETKTLIYYGDYKVTVELDATLAAGADPLAELLIPNEDNSGEVSLRGDVVIPSVSVEEQFTPGDRPQLR